MSGPAAACGTCGQPVIEAAAPGGPVLLRPRRAPAGTVAARFDGAAWHARFLPSPQAPLREGEARYQLHSRDCAGRGGGNDAWRKAQASAAHAQRAARGRRPVAASFGRAAGVRRLPPGAGR